MSSDSIPWRQQWRRLLHPAALALRLRAALAGTGQLREHWRQAVGQARYRRHPTPAEIRVIRPANLTSGPPELVAYLDPRDTLSAAAVQRALCADWPAVPTLVVVLVRYRQPPVLVSRVEAEVRSWAAPPAVVAHLPTTASLLTILDAALRQADVRLTVTQVGAGLPPAGTVASPGSAVAAIIPHQGSARWLAECLARLLPQLQLSCPAGAPDEALVCVDERRTAALTAVQTAFPASWFGGLRQPGVGPYVARQRGAERTRAEWLLFQDSDDVPTADRVARLRTAAIARDLDAVGSHELRLDYLTQRVIAVRFPLDASAALRVAMGHPVLFPTLLMRRASLLAAGGFSTHLRFALDTQLLLRASFTWRIGNVDAFLYVRRRRPHSLTTAPATALGSPARETYRGRWRRDFAAVQTGALALATSSLAAQRGAEYVGNELEAWD